MTITFYIDPTDDLPHISAHGVTEREVYEVFQRSPMNLHGREGTMFAIGQTAAGRILKVVYRRRATEIHVITAYDLRGKELSAFRRRRRRKPS